MTTTAPITETIRVDIRTEKAVLVTGLTLDEAVTYITDNTPRGLAVVLPSGGLLSAVRFPMWVRSMKGAVARNAARAEA